MAFGFHGKGGNWDKESCIMEMDSVEKSKQTQLVMKLTIKS